MNNYKPDPFADPEGHERWILDEAVRRMSERMASDADRQQVSAESVGLAHDDTEREVFWEGAFPEKHDPYEQRNDLDGLSQIEDWNGDQLTDEQLLARAMDPDDNILVENSTEFVRERDVDAQNEELRRQLAQREQQINNLNATYNPQWQQQRADARNQFLEANGLMSVDDERAGRLADQMANAQQELNWHRDQRVLDSINAQRAEYGDAFVDQAIAKFQRLDQRTPIAQAVNAHTYGSKNPGETFLAMMDGDVIDSMASDQHPHMRTGPSRPARPSRMPRMQADDGDFNTGYGDSSVEESIFSDAFK